VNVINLSRRQLSPPARPRSFRAEKMTPPQPGERCALCGQIKPEDEVVAHALGIIGLCTKAGLSASYAAPLMRLKLSKSELCTPAKLDPPLLKCAIVRRVTADAWGDVVAAQNKASGRG
jgi:hypothetical protein